MLAKIHLPVAKVFSPQMVRAARLVQHDEIVNQFAETKNVVLCMKGKALLESAAGDVSKVRNTMSNRIVEGFVSATITTKSINVMYSKGLNIIG